MKAIKFIDLDRYNDLLHEPPSYHRTEELKATYGSLFIQQQLNTEEL